MKVVSYGSSHDIWLISTYLRADTSVSVALQCRCARDSFLVPGIQANALVADDAVGVLAQVWDALPAILHTQRLVVLILQVQVLEGGEILEPTRRRK